MSFLAPLFLLGALAVVGPILFHLIRRTTREVTPFSSLMFLQPTPPRVTRRSRLENLWLLLLRCLVLGLLALGFARPFFPSKADAPSAAAGGGKRTVLLVDTSASMRREALWAEVKAKVEARLRATSPLDEVAVLAFDRTTRPLFTFEQWTQAKPEERAALAALPLGAAAPGWAATHLGAALLRAAELLQTPDGSAPGAGEIVVISDMQEGSRLDGLQGYEWPRGVRVILDPVAATRTANAGIQWLTESEDAAPEDADAPPRMRIANAAESKSEQFHIAWTGASAGLDIYVPAGQSRTVRAPQPPARAASLLLTGDETDFDNTVHFLAPEPTPLPILFLGNDAPDDSAGALIWLRRAFPKTREQSVEVSARRGDQPVSAFELQQAQLLVLGEGAAESALAAARQFADAGKIVVFPLTDASSAQALASLLGAAGFTADEARGRDYAMLAEIDFQHPLFAPFADPRFSDFTKIHFWKHRRIDLAKLQGARAIARFDDGTPAIVQVPLGKGSIFIFTSSWRPSDSQLALSSKFVPLLHSLLEQSSRLPARRAQYFVGDDIPLPPAPQPFTVTKPDGTTAAVPAASAFAAADQPGIYTVAPGTLRFAVNLAPDESRTSPLPSERLASLGVPLEKAAAASSSTAQNPARAQAAESESRQKVWRWLIAAALLVVLLETLIAAKLSRITRPAEAQP